MSNIIELPEGISKDKFKVAANKLLNECFLLKACKDTQSDYFYVLSNRELFRSFLDILGYELIINEEYGVVTLNNTTGTGRVHLSKRDSIILLILRVLFIEKKRELLATDDIIILVEEIYDKYQLLKLNQRLRRDMLQSAIGKFRRMHIVQNLDKMDGGDMGVRIVIYPSILLAVTSGSLDDMYQQAQNKLDEYENGGKDDDDNSEVEETDED